MNTSHCMTLLRLFLIVCSLECFAFPVQAQSLPTGSKIYYSRTSDSTLRRIDIDGTNDTAILTEAGITDIELDVVNGKIYYLAGANLKRANFDGSSPETIGTGSYGIAIALNVAGNKVFWSDNSTGVFYRADLNGDNVTTPIVGAGYGIDFDTVTQKVYFIDGGFGLRRSNSDGTSPETLDATFNSYRVAFDSEGGKVYWSNIDAGVKTVFRADANGSNKEPLLTSIVVQALELDTLNDTMYFREASTATVQKADFDGSNKGVAVTLTSPGEALALYLDADSDGTPDELDECPQDAGKTEAGMCGCGIADNDTDGDGTADCNDECEDDAEKTVAGDCGCGVADDDTDEDGTADCDDECDDDASKTQAGDCGCGVSDADTDGDGTVDCNDGCDEDANKIEEGICGCGTADTDIDEDGFVDCSGAPRPEVNENTKPEQSPKAGTPSKKKKTYNLLLRFEPLGKADTDSFGKGRFKVFYQVMWTRTRGDQVVTRMKTTRKPKYLLTKLKEGDVIAYKYRILVKKRKKNKKTGRVKFKTVYTSDYSPEAMTTIN